MTTKYFYQNIKSFNRFTSVAKGRHFHLVPDDWFIIITDVKSSTKAIESGAYKDVNMVGAASIVAAHNVMKGLSFPYVFGGDGATFLIPPEYEEAMSQELASLQSLSVSQFGLELRVAKVSANEILQEGVQLEVAKFSLVGDKSIAFFRGGGVSLAERKIKNNEKKYAIKSSASHLLNLEKLSCRWKPIQSKRGKILSLIIMARETHSFSVYESIISILQSIYQGRLQDANPVNLPKLEYKGLVACYKADRPLHASIFSLSFFKRLALIAASVFIFNFGLFKNYRKSMRTHSDYRKFDDMLRMVIDCSDLQAERIRTVLKVLYRNGKIYYGIHESKNSLITCFMEGAEDGEHIHFIDGDNGGYAMAAKQMKEQMKKA